MTLREGEHLVAVGGPELGAAGREAGLIVRDSLLVLVPGPRVLTAWLFRAPIAGTVVENIIVNGTGGLSIDASRVGNDTSRGDRYGSFDKPWDVATGRWPTNLVLVHGRECLRAGTKRVQATSIAKGASLQAVRRSGVHAEAKGHQTIGRAQPVTGHGDGDGLETVVAWQCAPGCPVALLDGQSGFTESVGGPIRQNGSSWKCSNQTGTYDRICDRGGASRFYPQFASFDECLTWLARLVSGARTEEASWRRSDNLRVRPVILF